MARQLGLLERARLEQEYDQARARADKLRTLHNLGMAIASSLELEQVLTRIVEAAVYITQAEEGSLLLLDEATQELHLRAQKGLGDRYARGFRIPVQDSVAGQVLQSGKPERMVGTEQAVKVVTGYLVNAILYVPIAIKGRSIGVLAVDNQASNQPFTEDDENLLLVLAGYAAIALENARRLAESERRFQTLAALHGVGQPEAGRPLEPGVAGILLGEGEAPAVAQALTPEYMAAVICPCLCAIAHLQSMLDELTERQPSEVRIVAITQGWPVPVSLQGANEALHAIRETLQPWRGDRPQATRQVAVALALDLLDHYRPGLLDADRVEVVTRLLPTLETLLSHPLQVSSPG